MRPPGLCGAARLAAAAVLVLGAPLALAAEDCLWYLDRNGSWHPGFSCEFFTFCCGTCYQRYCCRDLTLLITERQQKHCLAFSPKTIAGIASAVILFVAVVATTICCFLCSCCYLYRRRQHLQSPFEGQEIPMTGIPVQPVYPYPQDPKAGPAPPQPGYVYPPSGPAPQYPLYPAGPPIYNPAAPPPTCHHSPPTQEPEEPAVCAAPSVMPPLLYLHLALGGKAPLLSRPQPKPSPGSSGRWSATTQGSRPGAELDLGHKGGAGGEDLGSVDCFYLGLEKDTKAWVKAPAVSESL